MTKIVRKLALVAGATAVSVGVVGAVAMPADAAAVHHPSSYDSSWGR